MIIIKSCEKRNGNGLLGNFVKIGKSERGKLTKEFYNGFIIGPCRVGVGAKGMQFHFFHRERWI